jgi:uncharacterized damage-inducible protein DinB
MLDNIADERLSDTMASKGRGVGEQFAHIHNVRLMWLKAALPDALAGLEKIEKGTAVTVELLREYLIASGAAIEQLLDHAAGNGGKVKNFKPHVTAFVGYLIAHDAHHRSQAIIALKQAGQPLDKKVLYGIWEWGTR